MKVSSGVDPGGVRFGPAQYTLFVEGDESGSIDRVVLRELLEDRMPVSALGPSSRVRAVAKALQDHEPRWLFLIDRDFWSDDAVDRQHGEFAKGATNLLTWRRRAIENYFVDPKVFRHSNYLKSSPVLDEAVRKTFQERLFLDAVNIVIEEVRERLKNTWIDLFTDPGALPNKEAARTALLGRSEWASFRGEVGERTGEKHLGDQFDAVIDNLTGGGDEIQFDRGTWLERMDAKPPVEPYRQRVHRPRGERCPGEGKVQGGRQGLDPYPRRNAGSAPQRLRRGPRFDIAPRQPPVDPPAGGVLAKSMISL